MKKKLTATLLFLVTTIPQFITLGWPQMPEIVRNIFRGLSIVGGIAFVVVVIMLVREWFSEKRKRGFGQTITTTGEKKPEKLTDILTAMHRRLEELQKKKAKDTKIEYSQLKDVLPTLANKLGLVPLKDWPKYEKKVKQRVQRAISHSYLHPATLSFVERKNRAYLAALTVASAEKDALFQSKQWTFEDGMKISDWLDGFHWGIKDSRDNDPEWMALFHSLGYLSDPKLSELVNRHIDLSRFYNDVCLITSYSERFPKTAFFPMLYAELVGSPISSVKAEMALNEILQGIESYPGFTVVPKVLNRGAILEVTNNTQTATFRATGRVYGDIHHGPELFPLYWEAYGEHVELGNGDTRHILVARQECWYIGFTSYGLDIYKAVPSLPKGYDAFRSGVWGMLKGGSLTKADPVYLEVTIKPISSSTKEYRAYFVLEQPTITELVFRQVDSLPSIVRKEE